MRTFVLRASVALLGIAFAVPAFAANGSVSSSAEVASSADLACMSAAVDARESATINARATYHASIMAALNVRRDALRVAYTIANNNDRRAAITAAVRAYATVVADARAKFSADVKAAWSAFGTARVNCHIDDQDVLRVKMKKDDRESHDRGLHLGWLMGRMHSKAWINGSVKLDLSN